MISEANFIEGIGDEVVFLLGVCLLLLTIFLVWMSTQVHWDNQPIRVLVFRTAPPAVATAAGEDAHQVALSQDTQQVSSQELEREPCPPLLHEDGVHHRGPARNVDQETTAAATFAVSNPVASAVFTDSSEVNPETPGSLLLRLKYLDERQKVVSADPAESIINFKKRCFQQELSENKNVRLIFNGRELKEGSGQCLQNYGLTDEATIHCLITRRAASPESLHADDSSVGTTDSQSDEMDISGLMFPIFGVILAVIWYCRVTYRQYFNVLSTFALLGITVLFFVAAFTCWTFRVRQPEFLREESNPRIQHIDASH